MCRLACVYVLLILHRVHSLLCRRLSSLQRQTIIAQDPALQHLVVKKNETIMWEQWRGCHSAWPSSYYLVLRKLIPKLTVKRAPGPGAIRKTGWNTIANELLLDRKVILHTDSAKSYKAKVQGVLHDKVGVGVGARSG